MRKKTLTLLSFIKKKILEYGNHHNFIKMYKINFTTYLEVLANVNQVQNFSKLANLVAKVNFALNTIEKNY